MKKKKKNLVREGENVTETTILYYLIVINVTK